MRKKLVFSIVVFVIGLAVLITGLVFLIIHLTKGPTLQDGEFLVSVGKWSLEGEPGVEWQFTEIGKGKLTTNNHINDYDFIWAIDGGKLKVETKWLYQLNDEYDYKIDQNERKLVLNDEIIFIGEEKTEEN